jgi:hypothetical protein
MSVYRKFHEAAPRDYQQLQQQHRHDEYIAPSSHYVTQPHDSNHHHHHHHHHQTEVIELNMLKQKSRAHLAALSPIASAVGSTISSTPIRKHQYQRLVEASDTQIYQNYQAHCNHYQQVGLSYPMQQQHQQHPEQRQWSQCPSNRLAQPSLSLANIHLQESQTPMIGTRNANANSNNVYLSHEALIMNQRAAAMHRQQPKHIFNTDDPVLLKWMQAMRFETELECLTALQARTLAIDENSAAALSVRNSQVAIQEMRLESDLVLDLIDALIDKLPVNLGEIGKLADDFSTIHVRLVEQTRARTSSSAATKQTNSNYTYCNQLNNLTIINCTPRKSLVSSRTLKPLDKLAIQIREICLEMASTIQDYQCNYDSYDHIDNGQLEAMLRKIKELIGKFTEISIRAECANIVRALDHDFSKSSQLNRLTSNASLRPVRPYESSSAQLPLKWALIALWQLTKDDSYICRTLTEKWQTGCPGDTTESELIGTNKDRTAARPRAAKKLDYSTKYDNDENSKPNTNSTNSNDPDQHSLRSDYEKLYQICQNNEQFREKQQQLSRVTNNQVISSRGALSSALNDKQQPVKQVSTIELLIDIIISQPNRHERVDMMNFMQSNKLIDLEDLDQSISAAFYTSNQYKVAALRILNHLCINEKAIKTILRCFSTPPPEEGQPIPENKIIKSIFECYQTAQEHIYQNETIFNANRTPSRRCRKRARQQDLESDDYCSDYGSRQTNSAPTSESLSGPDDITDDEDGDDAVVKEAIQLLIQLTTPFYKSAKGHDYYILIGRFSIDSLVKYLTNIIKSTGNRKMLLLSLSALANISFITTEPMKKYETNGIVLKMFSASKNRSKDLELRDQAITILANTADRNVFDIVSNGGIVFLLSSLEVCPTRMANYRPERPKHDVIDPYSNINESDTYNSNQRRVHIDNKPRDRKPIDLSDEFVDDLDCACDNQQTMSGMQLSCLSRLTVGEMAALERIHQKTAVAFARMSIDPHTTKLVQDLGGVKQMIDLCKLSHKRNHSDTVLIACLTALRKMSKVIGREIFRHYNALDLIELDPDRALEIYGRLYASDV